MTCSMEKTAMHARALLGTVLLFAIPLSAHAAKPVMAAYYDASVPVARLPANDLTDIIYAFGEPGAGNICHAPAGEQLRTFAQLRALRAAHPGLRLLISIGGWGEAPQFSDAALTLQSRDAFAKTCIEQYVVRNAFDGIDIDWEFPVHGGVLQNPRRPQDRADVTALLAELRRQLHALGVANHRHYYLTIATPTGRWQQGGPYDPSDSYDLRAVARIVDWLNVMTYEMNNTFGPYSNFNTPMYEDPDDPTPPREKRWNNISVAVHYYEMHGVPPNRIVLGMAFFGRGFTGVSPKNGGVFSKYTGGFNETPWATVESRFLTDPTWQQHWSNSAQAPWLYNTRARTFFSYDDPRSMRIKATFVRLQHLRGMMFWVFGQDDANNSLLHALLQDSRK